MVVIQKNVKLNILNKYFNNFFCFLNDDHLCTNVKLLYCPINSFSLVMFLFNCLDRKSTTHNVDKQKYCISYIPSHNTITIFSVNKNIGLFKISIFDGWLTNHPIWLWLSYCNWYSVSIHKHTRCVNTWTSQGSLCRSLSIK